MEYYVVLQHRCAAVAELSFSADRRPAPALLLAFLLLLLNVVIWLFYFERLCFFF